MHSVEQLRAYLGSKTGAVEEYPFGPETLVFKVGGKIFALVGLNSSPLEISLKCDPVDAQLLRDLYPAVRPGYHLNKQHWNTITLDGSIASDTIQRMIDDSHALVLKRLPRAVQAKLGQ